MASSSFVRDLLTNWKLSKWIKNFEDEEINEEGFQLLKEKDIMDLIPKIGPRRIFIRKHKTFIKKRQKTRNEDKNVQEATSSSASFITTCKTSSGNAEEPCQKAIVNSIRSPIMAKRTMVNMGSLPKTTKSGVGETDLCQPSTRMGPPSTDKRKSDGDDANEQTKKQKRSAASRTTETFDSQKKTEVKKIMQSLRSTLNELPSTKLTDFLRDKFEMLEKDKKKIVGVFGKTGAGKSSLINTILGETKLLPSGNQGACTSVMIQVEANMTNEKYIAEIEFITVQEWEDELSSIFIGRSCEVGEDEDRDNSNDDDDDVEIISAFYGKYGNGKTLEELMDKKNFSKIPEFRSSVKKEFLCDTAEELSEKISCFTRSDTQNDEPQYWPLVKCITLKVPNSKDLLEHVVLVDLPGNGDCNKSRDEMWKRFVGNCSAVWIVSDIARATSEKECWEVFDSTVSLFGPGGECQSISFICTKTDDIEESQKDDARTSILTRNEITKMKVRDKFYKQKKVKKHFSGVENFFKVFTVSSKEYKKSKHLEKEETEIPHLQEFLRNLNDHHSRTSDYISGAYGILSLIQGAKNSNMTDCKEVCQDLEKRLMDNLKSISKFMEEPCKVFEQFLSLGVQQSEVSCEKLMDKVISPKHIVVQLKSKLEKSFEISLKTHNSLIFQDNVSEDYNKIKELMDDSSTVPVTPISDPHTKTTAFQSMLGNGNKLVQNMKITATIDPDQPNIEHKPTLLDSERNEPSVSKCQVPTDAETLQNHLSDVAFVNKNRSALIQRTNMVERIADDLFLDMMIQDDIYLKISKVSPSQEQMKMLLEVVEAGGKTVTSAFYKSLRKYELPLVQDLESASHL
ncbi:nuclear GTPase SLIP-GC isoform X3 [Esox lucius]|uniref:nuclear GTPase SLIP-GC isoform X3 n=1 Tax=Esox lucius TaxID=8010 RepID=UPI0014771185|nr:nuclear GTPase SLIP-GC isoform X3 [Esox lucius]